MMPADDDLARLEVACASLSGGHAQLCRHALSRLKAASTAVKAVESSESERVAGELEAAVAEVQLALAVQGESDSLVHRIATSQRFVARLYLVHKRIDEIYRVVGGEETETQQIEWRDGFHDDCTKLEKWLEERLELSTDAMVYEQMPKSDKQRSTLHALAATFQRRSTTQVENVQAPVLVELQPSEKLAALVEQMHSRLSDYAVDHGDEGFERPRQQPDQLHSDATKALWKAHNEVEEMAGGHDLCLRLSDRLERLLPVMNDQSIDLWWSVTDYFHDTSARFQGMLRTNNKASRLHQLATNQRLMIQVFRAHSRLDVICKVLGVVEDVDIANAWRVDWTSDRNRQEGYFTGPAIRSHRNLWGLLESKTLKETLTLIQIQLKIRFSSGFDYVHSRSATGPTLEMASLMQETFDRVIGIARVRLDDAIMWYVPVEDFMRDTGKDAKVFEKGTFGQVYKGTWMNEWEQTERPVAVKELVPLSGMDDNSRFSRELATWSSLHHENILEMLGTNHVSTTKFFIFDYASEGNVDEFFSCDGDNKKLLWDLFKQAAKGLQFLHENKVEHGGLKPTNILITRADAGVSSKLIAKVSDFGMTCVRGTAESALAHNVWSNSIRWMAPECFFPSEDGSHDGIDFRQSDMYSLGMCLWAAASGEPPYGLDDEETIVQQKFDHVPMERLDGALTDVEWELVSSMIENNPENRPSLEEAIERMGELDALRQRNWPFKEEATGAA